MFTNRKKLRVVWIGITALATISMIAYLLLPLIYLR